MNIINIRLNYNNFEQEIALFCCEKGDEIINYFFEIVVPQALEYFKENAKDVPSFLLLEVLLKNKNYEKDIQKMFELSEEISKKYNKK